MLNVAVIGYGYWGPNLVRNFQEAEHARVVVVCDQSEERLAKVVRRHPTVATTTSFSSVLGNSGVDAVAIATPVHTHYPLAKQALEAGKHVLVEKPLTLNVEHAEELVTLAKARGLVLMVDHVFVYSAAVTKMKELLDGGQLGKPFFIDSVRINLGLIQHDVNVVWDLAPHDLSIVDFLLGRVPRSVAAFGSVHANRDIEDVAYLNLDYGEGLIANFHVNWLSPVKVRQMIIGGSERSLIYDDLNASEKVKVYDRGITVDADPERRRQLLIGYRSGDVWSPNTGSAEPLARMVAHFAECVQDGRKCLSGGDSGLRVVRILDAAQRSIKTQGGRVVL